MCCFRIFWTKLTLRRFPNPLFPCGTKKISVRTHSLPTSTFYILYPYKQPTEHEPLTGQEEICFLNSEMPEKVTLVQVQINQNNLGLPTKLKRFGSRRFEH